jgi:RNA polymerase sigma-70 factor
MVVPETDQQRQETLVAYAEEFDAIYARCAEAYPEFGLPATELKEALLRSVDKYKQAYSERGEKPSAADVRRFLGDLQVLDLYLTIACAGGNEPAWWQFDRQYRLFIERVARHLARTGTDVDEVIESVYVELFGTKVDQGIRQSKFRSYTGRGSLRGWLRTIIWHTVVDLYRRKQDEVPLEEVSREGETRERNASRIEPHGSEEVIVENVLRERYTRLSGTALDDSLATLDDHETLLLLYYHVEGLKLREIARMVERPASPIRRWFQQQSKRRATTPSRVHESTVLRWLEKVYRKVADRFRVELAQKHGLNAAEIEICESIAAEDIGRTFRIDSVANPNRNLRKGEVPPGEI